MLWIFKKKEKKEKKLPVTGETWTLISANNGPWPSKTTHPINILDVKDGWVRYSIGDGSGIFSDERLKVGLFTHCYEFNF